MTYSFGTFLFDSGSLELTREGRPVRIEPQPARALACLLKGAGDLVTRDEMREAIWGNHTHVDYDRGLAYCLGQVRTALGDSGDNPRFVQTLPKRGYRFVAPVSTSGPAVVPATTAADAKVVGVPVPVARVPTTSPVDALMSTEVPAPGRLRPWVVIAALGILGVAGWRLLAPNAPELATVAVSIFDNETGDATYDAFVQGLSDVVVTRLASLAPGRVGVIGNATPLRQTRNLRNLKALAASLEADYILLGQLQRQDDGLRFIVHFIRLRDEVHLSAQRFIRPSSELQRFETDVVDESERVVRAFVVTAAGS